MTFNYLSVCSGIEAATVAWHDLGFNPVAFSEIEKFPSEVLQHYYPHVPNLGDMTKFKEWSFGTNIDVFVGGTPCQSFSVAGLRKGLDDPRGNLMLTYLAIAAKFKPKWILWENVPGVLSSGGGEDFASFLRGLGECGYGFAYRVLDAQYFGVAQRRRRVFVVGCLGDWRSAAAVLFDSHSLSWHPAPSRETRQETSSYVAESAGTLSARYYKGVNAEDTDNKLVYVPHVASCLETTSQDWSRADGFNMISVYDHHPQDSRVKEIDVAPTLNCRLGNLPIAFAENTIGRQPHNGGNGDGFTEGGPMYTLNATGVHGVAHAFKVRGGCDGGGKGYLGQDEKAFTISTTQNQQIFNQMAVRRLTPIECERLQGFPDNYTNIKPKCPDGPRYKALGNSMAVPVMRWIGNRITEVSCIMNNNQL